MENKELTQFAEPTGQFIMKSLISGGLYLPLQLLKYHGVASEEMDKAGIKNNFIFALFCTIGLATIFYAIGASSFSPIYQQTYSGVEQVYVGKFMMAIKVGQLLDGAFAVMCIMAAFKLKNHVIASAKSSGQENYSLNSFYLVIFHLFYINYCLNELKQFKK